MDMFHIRPSALLFIELVQNSVSVLKHVNARSIILTVYVSLKNERFLYTRYKTWAMSKKCLYMLKKQV